MDTNPLSVKRQINLHYFGFDKLKVVERKRGDRARRSFKICFHKITELLRALSLVDSCVSKRVCKHVCDVLDSRVLLRRFRFARTFESYFIKAIGHFFPFLCSLSRTLPALLVFRCGYVNTEKVLHRLIIK